MGSSTETIGKKNIDNEEEGKKLSESMIVGVSSEIARETAEDAIKRFEMPQTISRDEFDRLSSLQKTTEAAKDAAFGESKSITDPYTGKRLLRSRSDAMARYGDRWAEHQAEGDHIISRKTAWEENSDRGFLAKEDLAESVNSQDNQRVTSRRFNNAKREHSNSEVIEDSELSKKSGVTRQGKEAALQDERHARAAIDRHNRIAQVKNIAGTFHEAGVESMKYGAAIGGSISVAKNLVALASGDIDADEAIKNVAIDTAASAVTAYGTAGTGAVLATAMGQTGNAALKSVANSSLPAVAVQLAISSAKTVKRYMDGDIDSVECLTELGQSGTSLVVSSMCATVGATALTTALGINTFTVIGQVAIPIPVVGAMVGSMVGYVVSSTFFSAIQSALANAKFKREEREAMERACEEHIRMIREYRARLERAIDEYLQSKREIFTSAFNDMKAALEIGDIDGYIGGTNKIARALGKDPSFDTFGEFDALVMSGQAIKL